jgi:hypothetical protein
MVKVEKMEEKESRVFRVNRVALLNDGLLIVASIDKDNLAILKGDKNIEVKAEATPGEVILYVGKLEVPLPTPVLTHLAEKKKFFIFVSDFENYVLEPWISGDVSPEILWAQKGISDYLESA